MADVPSDGRGRHSADDDAYSLVITPAGLRRPSRAIGERISAARSKLVRVFYLVWFNLQKEAYGSSLGHIWLVLEPMLQALTYYLLIKFVFAIRGADISFAFFFSAITFWRSHATMVAGGSLFFIAKGHHYIQQNLGVDTAYLEHFVYEFFLFAIRFAVLVIFLVIAGYDAHVIWAAGVVLGLVQFLFSMALVVWLSIFGTFVRDLSRFVAHIVWFWWYMSPGLYSIGRIPDWARPIYELNPFAHLMPAMHDIMLKGKIPADLQALGWIFVGSSVLLWLGWMAMRRFGYRLYTQV
ncbi:MAG: ABC transporter permease [Pseudomonadota bacterium]